MDDFSGLEAPTADSGCLAWLRSSYSGYNGNCVEVADLGHGIAVRDSKAGRRGDVLFFGKRDWTVFLAKLKADPEIEARAVRSPLRLARTGCCPPVWR